MVVYNLPLDQLKSANGWSIPYGCNMHPGHGNYAN